MKYDSEIQINNRNISINDPTYFIADIASNHDGDLEKAKNLIWLAKESGADAVKFQHFLADKIVSDYGFRHIGKKIGHQDKWKKSVYQIYKEYECKRDWNEELSRTAKEASIDFITTPYDINAVESLNKYISAYKIGSGDITWLDFISFIAKKNKPILIATGASNMKEVERAVDSILQYNRKIVLMQCNTNYTGEKENFKFINLNVLKTYAIRYPNMLLGLSDHTPGHSTVLGAIALGARVIEKHFTSDNNLTGPDHAFSMNPVTWREMIDRTRELECALGTGIKTVEKNERDTVIIQRRCIRYKRDIGKGEILTKTDIECLRPAPEQTVLPYQKAVILGKMLKKDKLKGQAVYFDDLEV